VSIKTILGAVVIMDHSEFVWNILSNEHRNRQEETLNYKLFDVVGL